MLSHSMISRGAFTAIFSINLDVTINSSKTKGGQFSARVAERWHPNESHLGWDVFDDSSSSDNSSDMEDIDAYQPSGVIFDDNNAPDLGYDAKSMEMDGENPMEFFWNFEDLKEELRQPNNIYNGKGPCLKQKKWKKFKKVH